MMQADNHIFKGMRRDNHPARQDSSFLWDAFNVRLTNRDSDTGFAITNERGTTNTGVEFDGKYMGHCVLNNYLVVFTTEQKDDSHIDRIYRLTREDDRWVNIILFEGNLNFDTNHPLETLGDVETNLINKIYWTDGINQPRVINITALELKIPDSYKERIDDKPWTYDFDGLNLSDLSKSTHYGSDYYEPIERWYGDTNRTSLYSDTSFDFIQTLKLEEEVEVTKADSYGEFAPGVIQYALTYFNKYGQESNIFYVSPLQYIATEDRAGSPEEKINNSFKISISNPDNFDYIRIYSIHRTSLDAIPTVKIVADLNLDNTETESKEEVTIWVAKPGVVQGFQPRSIKVKKIEYIDTGLTGSIEDSTKLLYVGGQSILAGTLAIKDNTMFYGDITLQTSTKDLIDIVTKEYEVGEDITEIGLELDPNQSIILEESQNKNNDYYPYKPVYSNPYFKTGETYRLGLQFQFNTGKWSEPIPMNSIFPKNNAMDIVLNNTYPWEAQGIIQTAGIKFINHELIQELYNNGVRRLRTCVVFPKPAERTIICQGVLNPTVFNVKSRFLNNPYAQSSWFFRPSYSDDFDPEPPFLDPGYGGNVAYMHNQLLYSGGTISAEIQNMKVYSDTTKDRNVFKYVTGGASGKAFKSNTSAFAVDRNIVTMHSPEIEYGTDISNAVLGGCKLSLVGLANLLGVVGTNDISVNNTAKGNGFVKQRVGYPVNGWHLNNPNGGLVASCCFQDVALKGDLLDYNTGIYNFLVYPWHRTGSLNNDINHNADILEKSGRNRTAVLKQKIISNLKFFGNIPINASLWHNQSITTPQIFSPNEITGLKIKVPYLEKDCLYFGNIDDIIKTNDAYNIYVESGDKVSILEDSNVTTGTESVIMKYKSSPHLVFSLYDEDDPKSVPILPTITSTEEIKKEDVVIPEWLGAQVGKSESYDKLGLIGQDEWFHTHKDDTDRYIIDDIDAGESNLGQYQILRASFGTQVTGLPRLFHGERINGVTRWVLVKGSSNISLLFSKGKSVWYNYVNGDNKAYLNKVPPLHNTGKYIDSGNFLFQWQGEPLIINIHISSSHVASIVSYKYYDQSVVNSDDTSYKITNKTLMGAQGIVQDPILHVGELIRIVDPSTRFGGTSREAIKNNLWVPSSKSYSLTKGVLRTPDGALSDKDGNPVETPIYDWLDITVPYEYGDTWYTRYDCVKTYPFTDEDPNQVIEIGSFMLESHINLDGRYDTKRGKLENLDIKPDSYKLNDVYSQQDNFFNYRILDEDFYKQKAFQYQVTWTLSKSPAMDVDPWTNVTLANTLDVPSAKGKITKLSTLNDSLLCFQEKALNQIMFNSRVQVQATDGVPIEIANSGKVDGYRVLSDNIGCNNKWSIIGTSTGLYFIDKYSNAIYKYGDGITNLSDSLGMAQWVKNLDYGEWNIYNENPITTDLPGVRTFYDNLNGDIYFSPASSHCGGALCFSDKLNQFTSFMSYDNVAAMFNFDTGFYSLKEVKPGMLGLWENFTGPYGRIFDQDREFSITYVSNGDSIQSKVFDTVELEAQVERFNPDYNETENAPYDIPPFRAIRVANDYQEVFKDFDFRDIKKKFNVWRINIPRSNEVASPGGDISRNKFARARIRSPWAKITLYGNTKLSDKVTLYNTSTKYSI